MVALMIGLEARVVCCPFIPSMCLFSPRFSEFFLFGFPVTTSNSPNIDPPYPAYGGIYREEAIMLLRRFYVQENEKGKGFIVRDEERS